MKTKLGFLSNLTKNSFNSLGYEDWSTPQQSVPKATRKALSNNDESKVEDKNLITSQRINHEIRT